MKTDREIQADIEKGLGLLAGAGDFAITVAVADGIVTLTGFVPNYYRKVQAECVAKQVAGCAGIANDVQVQSSFAVIWADTELARCAVAAIRADAPGISRDVQVVVRDGQVTLEGTVDWQWQQQRLEIAVRALEGVEVVSNLLAIRPRRRLPAPTARAALRSSAMLKSTPSESPSRLSVVR